MPVPALVPLLDADGDLATDLGGARHAAARDALLVRVAEIERGPWDPGANPFGVRPGFGLLLLEGFIARRASLQGRTGLDLMGPGDVSRPWETSDPDAPFPVAQAFHALSDVRLAVLDAEACAGLGPYPELVDALVSRLTLRGRRLAGQLVISQLASVESRVLVALWRLAFRWGRVRADGVVLDVPLTHELLGNLVGARRPSVTHALTALAERGEIVRNRPRGWTLTGPPPSGVSGRRPQVSTTSLCVASW